MASGCSGNLDDDILGSLTRTVVVFRCDASARIGGGHATRCLALADTLTGSGCETMFVVGPESLATVPDLARHRCIVIDGVATEHVRIADALGRGVDWVVIDLYEHDMAFETSCRAWTDRILVVSDFADRSHDCDLLLDQTLGRTVADYAPFVPTDCLVLAGPGYSLVRTQFLELRSAAERRRATPHVARRLLLSFGATDVFRLTERVLAALLRHSPDIIIDVVMGLRASADLIALAATSSSVTLHRAVDDMAGLMLAADLAVGTAGTTAWERCTLGLPSALVIPVESFREITERLAARGAVAVVGDLDFDEDAAGAAIIALAMDADRLAHMSAAAFRVCDGLGPCRVASAIKSLAKTAC